jgi:DNA-binding MurR/RpiR family transcriptional regulator
MRTDQWLSPIARFATRMLSARVAVPSVWDSSVALLALAEALLSEVTRQGWDYSRGRIAELEKLRGSMTEAVAAVSAPRNRDA